MTEKSNNLHEKKWDEDSTIIDDEYGGRRVIINTGCVIIIMGIIYIK